MSRSFIIRLLIITGWFSIITSILYIPSIYHMFFEDENTLHVVAFAQLISPQACDRFKKQTGISVRLTHVESDDEIIAKLKLNKNHGYDLLIAFDYTIDTLRKINLLAPLDYTKIDHFRDLDARFLNKEFDPNNIYSLPFSWLMYGIGYDASFFNNSLSAENISWDLIFKSPHLQGYNYRICMLNEMREVFFLAAIYFRDRSFIFSKQRIEEFKKMLIYQKSWVESYASDRVDYLLIAKSVPLALTPSSYMKKVLSHGPEFSFAIPSQGSVIGIENCAIPRTSKKSEKAHAFINFLLSEEIAALNSNEYGLYPVNVKAYELLDKKLFERLDFPIHDTLLKNSVFIRNDAISLNALEDLWIAIKAT